MAVLSLTDAQLAYGHVPLLDHAGFALERGERVGLIGRNGTGKSSLLKILAGREALDDGLVQRESGLVVREVAQEPLFDPAQTVFDAVADGVADVRALRERYEQHDPSEDLDALQAAIEARDGWMWEQRVESTLQRLHLDGTRRLGELSGGVRKRVALGQALAAVPDVLLLDEPTNHLDIDTIAWLEELLVAFRGSVVVVTHDRAFLDAVATRIVELDRGVLRSYPGNFAAYEARKAEELSAEALANARADKLLAQEEVWVRKGVEARRTRAVGRIKRLEALRVARASRRDSIGRVKLQVDAGERSGRIVADLEDASFAYPGGPTLVDRFTATILRGDKVGLVGPNGVGKTTLLKLLLGELEPTAGSVRRGHNLQVAYFDQLRGRLDLNATLADAVSPGSEWIETANGRQHVMGYLGDFLFPPARANAPVATLSGGERSRLLLARLFALPANVIVLDEPTNDLDVDTLDLLEDLLLGYKGTVFVVSHDRRFLDNVVTSTIAWEGDVQPGRWREYEGGWSEYRLQRERAEKSFAPPKDTPSRKTGEGRGEGVKPPPALPPAPKSRLGYKDQRELDALPDRIESLEREQKEIEALLGSAELYADDPARVEQAQTRYATVGAELDAALARWEDLASRQ